MMKTKEEIEQLAQEWFLNDKSLAYGEEFGFIQGYTQCQEDMAKELEMHILVNEHDWSRNPQVQLKDFIKQLNNIGTKDDDLNFLGQITI